MLLQRDVYQIVIKAICLILFKSGENHCFELSLHNAITTKHVNCHLDFLITILGRRSVFKTIMNLLSLGMVI